MKKLKYEILFTILFMTVGIAAVSSNVFLSGSTQLVSNSDDFNVYFSDVLVDGEQNLSLVQNETSLVFTGEFSVVGDKKEITYDVTNASKNYDADIDITCTQSTEYLTISNSFDTDSYLSARSTKSGVLTIILSKSYTGADLKQDISCTINASAVEKNSQGSGNVDLPLSKYAVGTEISIGDEKFNIISESVDTVTLWAQYNVDSTTVTKQVTSQTYYAFSNSNGWEYTPGPKDINIQSYDGSVKTLVNNYIDYLDSEFAVSAEGSLISLKELGNLGCGVAEDYSNDLSLSLSCADSPYIDWIYNEQFIWTRSAYSGSEKDVWTLGDFGDVAYTNYDFAYFGVRPTITISKELCDDLLNNMIFFTIDDVVYKAKSGMTWGEWIDSEYNTGGFTSWYGVLYYYTRVVYGSDGTKITDAIISGSSYKISEHSSGGSND